MRRWVGLLIAVLITVTVIDPVGAGAAPTRRPSFTQVENQLMCVVCHEPLSVANSPQAFSERAYLRQLIAEGLTQKQIIDRFVFAYTTAVLAKPPARGFSLLVYVLPPVLLAIGIVTLLVTIPRWRRRARPQPGDPAQPMPALDPDDARRLDADLARHP